MKNMCGVIIAWFLSSIFLYGGTGLTQPHLINTVPSIGDNDISTNIIPSFAFDSFILEKSIDSNTITLKQKRPKYSKIDGKISIIDKKSLIFVPQQQLEKGIYSITLNPLSLQKEEIISIEPKNNWEKFVAWVCSMFYNNIEDCPLCQHACYAENTFKTKLIHFEFEITKEAPKVISLESNTTFIELAEHSSAQIKVMATYDDNSSEDVTEKAIYKTSGCSVDLDNGIINTESECSGVIAISYGGQSTEINIEVYEMIEGYLLPHEPKNPDATLLGVDKNNNGVRDEVERWIYKEMPTYHHPEIERVIAMQDAKAYQMSLTDPANKDDKVLNALTRGSDCWSYYSYSKQIPFDDAIEKFGNMLRDKQFNTKERLQTYMDYDYTLKGRVFTSTPLRLLDTSYCDVNIDAMP